MLHARARTVKELLLQLLTCHCTQCAVVLIPEKPNQITPQSCPKPEMVAHAKATLTSMSILKHEDASPQDIHELPVTGNQEYGFHHKPLMQREELFYHPKVGCDVTGYADAYYSMTGCSPYARKTDVPA